MYALQKMNSIEATKELCSLESGRLLNFSSYSACITNSVRFLTYNQDIKLKTQNSRMFVPRLEDNTFYGQLEEIIEFTYLHGFSVLLFRANSLILIHQRRKSKQRIYHKH